MSQFTVWIIFILTFFFIGLGIYYLLKPEKAWNHLKNLVTEEPVIDVQDTDLRVLESDND